MKTLVPENKNPAEMTINKAMVAMLLNVSQPRVAAMTSEGILHQSSRGRWKLIDAVHHYIAFCKQETKSKTKGASETRVRDARAAEIELRMARTDREIIPIAEALATIDGVTGDYLQSISSLPARITREQNERRRIEAICDEERARLGDHFTEKSFALRTGIPIAETDDEVDA